MPQVVVIGAGLTGLSFAFRLRQACPGAVVTILEKANRPGGNIWTERRDGFQVEWGPNGFLDNKPSTIQLCRDLALASRLLPGSELARKNRYLFWKGKLQLLPGSIWSFLTSPLLSPRGKINLLLERYRKRPAYLGPEESIAAFARRRAGREVADVFADAMVTGIHGGDANLLSLPAAFPRVDLFERQTGSVMRGFANAAKTRRQLALQRGETPQPQRMWSFRNGLRELIEHLHDVSGARVLKGVTVRSVSPTTENQPGKPRWLVRGEGTEGWPADAVVLACPAYEQATIVGDFDPVLAEPIQNIPYNAIAVVALGFRQIDCPRPADGFGYIAPQATKRDVLGVQWCSSIYPDRAPPGMVLWRALCGGWHRREMVACDDDTLAKIVLRELRLAMKVQGEPVFRSIVRWQQAIPQYTLGHLERVATIERRANQHPGLFLAGNAYHGVAINDCTEQAEILSRRVAGYLQGMAVT